MIYLLGIAIALVIFLGVLIYKNHCDDEIYEDMYDDTNYEMCHGREPNKTTLKAMRDAKNGKGEKFNIEDI